MKKIFLPLITLLINILASGAVRLPKIFGDSMILQRGISIPVWGWADKNEKIIVQFNRQNKITRTGGNGFWKVTLDPEKEGGPYQLVVKGENTITLNDILIGDVWICSGQSNMEFTVSGTKNSIAEIAAADFPLIRHVKIEKAVAEKPLNDVERTGGWQTATPSNTGNFTAVGYFFARTLYEELHVPIGLINTTWGGTDVETWTGSEAMESSDEFKNLLNGIKQLNLDSVARVRSKLIKSNIEKLQGAFADSTAVLLWKESSFDDTGWPQIKLPGLWEQQSLHDVDGIVWFRKTVFISADDAGKPAQLSLAMIDDNDDTYINGIKVGSTKGYNVKRNYQVAAGILKEGKNVIAVRVEDTGGGGGIYGDSSDLKLTSGNTTQSIAGIWLFKVESILDNGQSLNPNSYPALLYNAMIHPLIPFAFKGVIWYQGENNASRAFQYRKAFPLMITDWRKQWRQGDFPFYFVQLASFNSNGGNSKNGSTWAELREAQTKTLSLPNTGMAVTTDIGEANDIHPKNKQDVGNRLAAIALNKIYGKQNIYMGPSFTTMKTNGNIVTLSLNNIGGGLITKDKYGYVRGFELAGADKQFHYAKASIEGSNVVLFSEEVPAPVAVRYAWSDDAGDANLYNKEDFPAAPFRTDDWKGITEDTKYTISK